MPRRRPRRDVRIRRAFRPAEVTTVTAPHSGPQPAEAPPPTGGGGPVILPAALCPPQEGRDVTRGEEEPHPSRVGEEVTVAADDASSVGAVSGSDLRAACRLLADMLIGAADVTALECGGLGPRLAGEDVAAAAGDIESPLGALADRRRPVSGSARVRPPVATRVDASLYSGHPRLRSVLTRGLRVRVPAAAPRVWAVTPRSPLMSDAVRDFVSAGVFRPGRPRCCYRLVPVPKNESTARLIYDLSSLTPFMPRRPCSLPSVDRALELAAAGYTYGIKIDLRDGFYHIPLAESNYTKFGICYDGSTYVFTRMPMGLSIASSEMQHFACATVKLIQDYFPGVRGIAYLDDFLFVARHPAELRGIEDYFTRAGININFEKSVLSPVSRIIYLGVDIDLSRAAARVKPGVLSSVRSAMMQCSTFWPVVWRQRLAGYVNFLRPCLKLPLEVVSAILDGDVDACAAVVSFMYDDVEWSFWDICRWNDCMTRYVMWTPPHSR